MINLRDDDQTKLLKMLIPLPILRNERNREAVLESANLQELRPQLDLSGEPAVAIPIMINAFCKYGRLTYDQEALGRFLNTMKDYVGLEEQQFLDAMISKYRLMTPSVKSTVSVDWVIPATQTDVLEQIIGENTLHPIAFLQQGLNVSRSVAYIEVLSGTQKWSGTGFMISPSLLLTNHHVLPQKNLLPETIFRFNYQLDVNGNPSIYKDYFAIEAGLFLANKNSDYAIVELQGDPGNEWGYLELRPRIPSPDDRVNIIQHPNGLPKQISIQNNFVKFANSTKIQYITSTLPGSSGSPVLDNDWKVIGLHHAGGMLPEEDKSSLFFRNEGIAMQAILDDLPDEIKKQLSVI